MSSSLPGTMQYCKTEDCGRPHHAKGLCKREYDLTRGNSRGKWKPGEVQKARSSKNRSIQRAEKREYIKSLKDNKPCTDCRMTFRFYILHYDHTETNKIGNLSDAATAGWSFDKINKEISKCELVCANCHAERTWSRLNLSDATVIDTVT